MSVFLNMSPSIPTTGTLSPESFLGLCLIVGPLLSSYADFSLLLTFKSGHFIQSFPSYPLELASEKLIISFSVYLRQVLPLHSQERSLMSFPKQRS